MDYIIFPAMLGIEHGGFAVGRWPVVLRCAPRDLARLDFR